MTCTGPHLSSYSVSWSDKVQDLTGLNQTEESTRDHSFWRALVRWMLAGLRGKRVCVAHGHGTRGVANCVVPYRGLKHSQGEFSAHESGRRELSVGIGSNSLSFGDHLV